MNSKLKETFDKIHAEEELKIKTKAFLRRKTGAYQKKRVYFKQRYAPIIACLFLIILSAGGIKLYFTPTTVISIDINPSLELGINIFDRIISVKGYNDDGNKLADSADIKFLDYKYGLEQIINSPVIQNLTDSETLSITVAGSNQKQCINILSNAQKCTNGRQNTYCSTADYSQIESAHHCGLSVGRYTAYTELKALDSSITPEEINQMTMKEIHSMINQLSGENIYLENTCQEKNEYGHGKGQHHKNH